MQHFGASAWGEPMNKIFETPLYGYERSPDQDSPTPVRRKVIVIGAGPVGLAAAIDGPCARCLDAAGRPSHALDAVAFDQNLAIEGITAVAVDDTNIREER